MLKILVLAIASLLLLIPGALAEQSQERTIKTFLNPFYVGSWIGGTNPITYNYNIDVSPPDGLSSVKSAIISWDVWVSPSVNFTLKVNGRPCNTPFYYISTTYASSGLARINFDCSDEIKSKGHYIVSMTASKDCGSSTGWLELTYMNNPLYMTTGGTEYQFGQNATAFVRLVDGSNRPINLGSCNAAVFYPNKTLWIQNNNMTFLNSGYYYSDLGTVPSIEGVYIVSFDCIIPAQIFSQTEAVSSVLASGDTYSNFFGFDNDENFSINAVNMTVRASRGGAATTINVTLNGNIVQVISLTGTPTSYNFPVGIGNISVAEDQLYSIINNGISSVTLESVSLFVNYTSIQPQQIIRGQTELHVSGWISGLNNTLYPFIADTWNNTKEAHMGYVSGSIYAPNDTGEAEILFLDRTGAPVTNANCTITIEYPNETVWISSANMSRELETDGFFEYQFKVPDTVGIYTTSIACTSPSVTGYVGGDFQVQNPASIKYVGGTEYSTGQDGRVVVQLLSAAGAPINTGTCTGNLSYPNNTRFATNFALSYQTASNGIYAFNFTVPSTEGIYVSDVKCTGGPLTLFTSGTFHVSAMKG